MEKYIKGNYSRSIYENNGFVIGLFKIKETNVDIFEDYIGKTITFKGYFETLKTNETYIFYGVEVEHPRYGLQFDVNNYEKVKPTDRLGVITFLSSDIFPTIGEVLASKIVDTLGVDAINIILDNPTSLDKVPKLSGKKKNIIITNLVKYNESHNVIVSLTELGFNMKDSLSLYNKYSSYILDIISTNIYVLIDEMNFSFPKIDSIALEKGYLKDDPNRIKACITYCMKNLIFENGDTYLYKDEIYKEVCDYLKDEISLSSYLDGMDNIIKEEDRYYLKDMWEDDNYIAKRLKKLSNKKENKKLLNYLDKYEAKIGIKYNEEQKNAIIEALTSDLVIITGGPGVGKTTIIKAIVDIYSDLESNSIALLAPTGRASKRLSLSCNMPAKTIHSFLKWNKDDNTFLVNELNKDTHDLIIVDEVSMIDQYIFASLLKGIKENVKLILVGDYNQLPSVGPGMILKDLIDSNSLNTVYLEKLYRQSSDSYIPYLAKEIKDNELAEYKDRKDYTFLSCDSMLIKEGLSKIIKQAITKDKVSDIQIMAPMYKGDVGIDSLNKMLQDLINPASTDKEEYKSGDTTYRVYDKVLQLQNMPDDNVYNGDIGYIIRIEKGKKEYIYVSFDGNVVRYSPKDLVNISLGYIISIHKSQGSEFDTVILPMSLGYKRMLYKNLIYTAVTRAKRKLIIIGDYNAFLYGVANDKDIVRKSYLKYRLMNK